MRIRLLTTVVSVAIAMMVILGTASPLYAYTLVDHVAGPIQPANEGSPDAPLFALAESDIQILLDGVLAPGTLGLPGEMVQWVVTITNTSSEVARDVAVTTTLHEGLRVDTVEALRGEVSISEPVVVVTVTELNPGEVLEFTIVTTVLRSPSNGRLFNQTVLAASGPNGEISRSASAEMYVPTGLPATGYAPDDDLPGEGEPSVVAVGLMAFSTVAFAALFVWYRGRKTWI